MRRHKRKPMPMIIPHTHTHKLDGGCMWSARTEADNPCALRPTIDLAKRCDRHRAEEPALGHMRDVLSNAVAAFKEDEAAWDRPWASPSEAWGAESEKWWRLAPQPGGWARQRASHAAGEQAAVNNWRASKWRFAGEYGGRLAGTQAGRPTGGSTGRAGESATSGLPRASGPAAGGGGRRNHTVGQASG